MVEITDALVLHNLIKSANNLGCCLRLRKDKSGKYPYILTGIMPWATFKVRIVGTQGFIHDELLDNLVRYFERQ